MLKSGAWQKSVLFFVNFCSFVTSAAYASYIAVPPANVLANSVASHTQPASKHAMIALLPGALRPAEEYAELANAIANAADFPLWVVVPSFMGNMPTPFELNSALEKAKKEAASLGMPKETVSEGRMFLAGHSGGGVVAIQGYLNSANSIAGAILFSAYLPRGNAKKVAESGANSSLNMLTIAGELDGLTPLTRVAQDRVALEDPLLSQKFRLNKLVVIPGMNHSDFANGDLQKGDLLADADRTTAQQQAGSAVAAFVSITLGKSFSPSYEAYKQSLQAAEIKSNEIIAPFVYAKKHSLDVCEQGQTLLVGKETAEKLSVVKNVYTNIGAFAASKPKADFNEQNGERRAKIEVSAFQQPQFDPLDISRLPNVPQQVACKLKNPAYLQQELGQFGNPQDSAAACREINRLVWNQALGLLSPAAKARFEQTAFHVEFLSDRRLNTGVTWVSSNLELGKNFDALNPTLAIRSPALTTGEIFSKNLSNMQYCKVISLEKAVEFAFLESRRALNSR